MSGGWGDGVSPSALRLPLKASFWYLQICSSFQGTLTPHDEGVEQLSLPEFRVGIEMSPDEVRSSVPRRGRAGDWEL